MTDGRPRLRLNLPYTPPTGGSLGRRRTIGELHGSGSKKHRLGSNMAAGMREGMMAARELETPLRNDRMRDAETPRGVPARSTTVERIWSDEAQKIKAPLLSSCSVRKRLHFYNAYKKYTRNLRENVLDQNLDLRPRAMALCVDHATMLHMHKTKFPLEYRLLSYEDVPATAIHEYIESALEEEKGVQRREGRKIIM